MEEYDDFDGEDEISFEIKLDRLSRIFFEALYEEVRDGDASVDLEDIEDAIEHFTRLEEYEKCIILKKALKKRKK